MTTTTTLSALPALNEKELATFEQRVAAFHQFMDDLEKHQTALVKVPAPILLNVRPRTLTARLCDVCYELCKFTAVFLVCAMIALFIGAALAWEAGKAAHRYWVEHNLGQVMCEQALLTGLYVAAALSGFILVIKSMLFTLGCFLAAGWLLVAVTFVQFCQLMLMLVDRSLAVAFQVL
ncbi:MAG: hypothetical protein AAFZ17_20565 [Cyanobacteria bacterium J06650_10]